jgi:hypothetical protein
MNIRENIPLHMVQVVLLQAEGGVRVSAPRPAHLASIAARLRQGNQLVLTKPSQQYSNKEQFFFI